MQDQMNLDEEQDPIRKAIMQAATAAQPADGTDVVGGPRSDNTGVSGGIGVLGGTPTATADPNTPSSTPDYRKLGQYAGQMGNWSQDPNNLTNDKFKSPWDDQSERYQMLTVLSNFDPKKGITPEVIDALNKAGIKGGAKFSGSGDKLNVENVGNYDRFGSGGEGDIIQGLHSGNGQWAPWMAETGDAGNGAAGGSNPNLLAINPLMGGGGSQAINPALTSSDFFQKLLDVAKRQAGPELTNQDALLSLMG